MKSNFVQIVILRRDRVRFHIFWRELQPFNNEVLGNRFGNENIIREEFHSSLIITSSLRTQDSVLKSVALFIIS